MNVFRIAHNRFINDLEGIGALRFGGRWNPKGLGCLYCSEHLSLAFLEKLVHTQGRNALINLSFLQIEIPGDSDIYTVDISKMQPDWTVKPDYTQWLGKQLLEIKSYLGFRVPSVMVPGEWNVILNPQSIHFQDIKVLPPQLFIVDERLVSKWETS